ncbi:MAG: ribonuclease D [Alphaproteobacteria bacterium]|nr:ribonuclease D [Alphaproteobacteria bacterium]
MTLIVDSEALAAFCHRQEGAEYVAVDTEFMRDKTYWPKLCLVQVAGPDEAVAIDAMAPGIDLGPLWRLMVGSPTLKVFHAARQDIEIFVRQAGGVPVPVFDTQVAAMVCGFGDSVAYDTLVAKLAGAKIDKSSRYTDWQHRPLSQRQIDYALSDVVHLRKVYERLRKRLQQNGRAHWLEDELGTLTDPDIYRTDPEIAWQRIKVRGGNPRFLAVLRDLAAWREREAQRRDIPRSRILRDDSLLDIAAHPPSTIEELARGRGVGRGVAEGKLGADILAACQRGLASDPATWPKLPPRPEIPQGLGPLVDLLRVLLKTKSEINDVAQRLVATTDDLELIAADDNADVSALKGWRREVFGEDALALKHGRLALAAEGAQVKLIRVDAPAHGAEPALRTRPELTGIPAGGE